MEFYNKMVCCTPPVQVSAKKHGEAKGLASADKSIDLVPLTVAYASEELGLMVDDLVYVRSDRLTQGWANERIRIQGEVDDFVLVPLHEVVAGAPGGFLKKKAK